MRVMDRAFEQRVGWRIEDSYPPDQIRLLQQTASSMDHYGLGKIEVREEGQIGSLGDPLERGWVRVVVCGHGLRSLTAFKNIFGFAREIEENLGRVNTKKSELIQDINEVIRVQTLKAIVQGKKL